MKDSKFFLHTLIAAAAMTIPAYADVVVDFSDYTGINGSTDDPYSLTVGRDTISVDRNAGAKFFLTDGGDKWTNTRALADMSAVLNTTVDEATVDGLKLVASGAGQSINTFTLDIGSIEVGMNIVLYTFATNANNALSNLSFVGLDNAKVSYATNTGTGFSTTAAYTSAANDWTLFKVTGVVTDANIVISGTQGKTGLGMVAYSDFYKWAGSESNNKWDTTSTNWNSGVSYVEGHSVVFDSTAGYKTVAIDQNVGVKTIIVEDSYTFSFAENGSLTAKGMYIASGTTMLTGVGTVNVETLTTAAEGALSVAGGAVNVTTGADIAGAVTVSGGALTLGGEITLGRTITVGENGSLTFAKDANVVLSDSLLPPPTSTDGYASGSATIYTGAGAVTNGKTFNLTVFGESATVTGGVVTVTDYSTYYANTATAKYSTIADNEKLEKIVVGANGVFTVDEGALTCRVSVGAGGTIDLGTHANGTLNQNIVGDGAISWGNTATSHDTRISLQNGFRGTLKLSGNIATGNLNLGGTTKIEASGVWFWGASTAINAAIEVVNADVFDKKNRANFYIGEDGVGGVTFNGDFTATNAIVTFDLGTNTFAGSKTTIGTLNIGGGKTTISNGTNTITNLAISGGEMVISGGTTTVTNGLVIEGGFLTLVGKSSAVAGVSGDIAVKGGAKLKFTGHDALGYSDNALMSGKIIAQGSSETSIAEIVVEESGTNVLTLSKEIELKGHSTVSGTKIKAWNGKFTVSGTNNTVSSALSLDKNLSVYVANEGAATFDGQLSGSGKLIVTGGGTLTLFGEDDKTANYYTGGTDISGATVVVKSLGWGGNSDYAKGDIGGGFDQTLLTISDGGVLKVMSAQNSTGSGYGNGGSERGFSVTSGEGTYRYSGTGTSKITHNSNSNQHIGIAKSFPKDGKEQKQTLIFDVENADATLDVSKVIASTSTTGTEVTDGAVNKIGAGTLILSGNNKYTGGTTIFEGVLATGSASALGSGDVSLWGGAQLQLNTDLTVSGNLKLAVSNMDIVDSGYEKGLICGGVDGVSLTLSPDSLVYVNIAYMMEFSATDSADTLALKLATGNVLSELDATNFLVGIELPGVTDWQDSTTWKVGEWNGEKGILTLVAVPEPSAFGLLAGVGALALVASRRRRRSR